MRRETDEPVKQIMEWSYPYAVYDGQYNSLFPNGSKEEYMDNEIKELWSKTLPRLLLAESEERFDEILAEFVKERDEYGFKEIQEAKTELMKEAKAKMGID